MELHLWCYETIGWMWPIFSVYTSCECVGRSHVTPYRCGLSKVTCEMWDLFVVYSLEDPAPKWMKWLNRQGLFLTPKGSWSLIWNQSINFVVKKSLWGVFVFFFWGCNFICERLCWLLFIRRGLRQKSDAKYKLPMDLTLGGSSQFVTS